MRFQDEEPVCGMMYMYMYMCVCVCHGPERMYYLEPGVSRDHINVTGLGFRK